MDKIQEKLLDLLKRIDETCREYSIKYFLGQETALCAVKWGHFPEHCSGATVYMLADDYDRFEEITSADSDKHTVESMATNPGFPFPTLLYVDKNTTRINLSMIGLQKHPGIAVKVVKLIPFTPRDNNDLLRDKIALATLRNEDAFGTIVSYPEEYSSFRIERIRRNTDFALKVYRSGLNVEKDGKIKYYLQQYRKKTLIFGGKVFKGDPVNVTLEGVEFAIPKNYKSMLKKLYGKTWQSREITFNPLNNDFIVDTETPYACYMPILENLADTAESYRKAKQEKIPISRRKLALLNAIENQRLYYERTKDKFYCIDKYLPAKEQILSLYEKGDFYALSLLLTDYQIIVEKFAKKEIPFAFDKDFYYIMCDILNWQGRTSLQKTLSQYKSEAFAYVDKTVSGAEQVLSSSLYRYHDKEHCLKEKKRFLGRTIPAASEDQLESIARKRYEMLSQNDDDTTGDNGEEAFERRKGKIAAE